MKARTYSSDGRRLPSCGKKTPLALMLEIEPRKYVITLA
jgi:hypothetical protein